MCKKLLSSVFGSKPKDYVAPAAPVADSTGDSNAQVKDTSVGDGMAVNIAGRENTGRVRLNGTKGRRTTSVGLSL